MTRRLLARASAVAAMPPYSPVAWGYISFVAIVGLGLEAMLIQGGTAFSSNPDRPIDAFVGFALFGAAALAGMFPVKLGPAQKMNLGTAAEFAAVLFLPPAFPGLISAGSAVAYSCVLRRPWFNVLFSAGQHALCAGVAALVYSALWGVTRPPLSNAMAATAVAVAALVFITMSTMVVSGVVATTQRRAFLDCLLGLLRQSWAQYTVLIATGGLAVVCLWFAPWAIILTVLGLPLVHELNLSLQRAATAKEEVEAILTRQRRFVSDVAHEIGTPLTTLSGNMAVLESGVGDDPIEVRETLQDLSAEFSRLSGIFSHLMVLAEADERNQIVRRTVFLDQLVNDLVMMWSDRAGQFGLSLEVGRVDPAHIEGDEGRIRQMLGELLENARRYTPTGGKIAVEVQSSGSFVRLVVSDTGMGISSEDLPHIFERFYRGEKTRLPARSRVTGGSGLGLSIVKWCVEMHGGRVFVDTTPGSGSRFTVEFPLAESRLV